MIVDLDALARTAAELAAQKVIEALPSVLTRVLDERADPLQPLAAILGISSDAAAMRLRRDPELRALGLQSTQRRLLFRRSEVEHLMAERARAGRAPRLRSLGGAR